MILTDAPKFHEDSLKMLADGARRGRKFIGSGEEWFFLKFNILVLGIGKGDGEF